MLTRSLLIEVVDEDVVVPLAVAHVEVVHVGGEVGKGRAGGHGGGVVGGTLKPLGEDGDLLAELTGLDGVGADELFLVELELIDELVHLHLLTVPVLLVGEKTVVLDPEVGEVVLEVADLVRPRLLLLFKLLGVLLLPLAGVETTMMLASERIGTTQTKRHPKPDAGMQKPKGVRTRPVCSGGVVFVALVPSAPARRCTPG